MAGDDGLIGIAFQEIDDDFLADAGDEHATPVGAGAAVLLRAAVEGVPDVGTGVVVDVPDVRLRAHELTERGPAEAARRLLHWR